MTKHREVKASRRGRLAGVVGGVAATALCLSFAWSVVGGALRPAAAPLPDSIIIATAAHPDAHPPLPPFRKPAPPNATAKYATPETRKSLPKSSPAEKIAAVTTPDTPAAATTSVLSLAAVADSLLASETKASRTRGQPAQD